MTGWSRSPVPLSRSAVLAFMAKEAQERREQREREQRAEEARERAEAAAVQYHAEHGEWPWVTRAREMDVAARAEAREEEQRRVGRAEQQQARYAARIAAGRSPRSVSEILAVAALYA